MAIFEWQFEGVPWAVLDVETTGLIPGSDRIIEVAVAHLDSNDDEPRLVFDTLIDPRRSFEKDIHGIDEEDVARAPLFVDIARELAGVFAGRVLAAHNAHFDMTFLAHEFNHAGIQFAVPYACTMDLVSVLGLGRRASLRELSEIMDMSFQPHLASEDAMAAAHLLILLRRSVRERKIRSFGELMQRASPSSRYVESWSHLPLTGLPTALPSCPRVSRSRRPIARPFSRLDYGAALIEALSDFVLTDEEEARLKRIQQEGGLHKEQIRAAHAAALVWMMTRFAAEGWLDDDEAYALHEIMGYLRRLGWAPGDFS